MDFFEKYNLSAGKIAKMFGLFLLALVAVLIAFQLLGGIFKSTSSGRHYDSLGSNMMSYGGKAESAKMMDMEGLALSTRNIMPQDGGYTPGMDAEAFEITEYNANIETRKLDETCNKFFNLKESDDVVFEASNAGDTNCYFRFKVKKENEKLIVEMIESLDPRYLNENIHTIKKQIDDYTSQEEILKKKLETVESTLSQAVISYDEISRLSAETRNPESLASVIESKIRILERLTNEKINITTQLDRISRTKAEQLDRLEYTYFDVNIYENKYVDMDQIKDSWKSSIKQFVRDINRIAQDMSVGLVTLVAKTFQFLVYLFIVLLVAKFVWKSFRRMWMR